MKFLTWNDCERNVNSSRFSCSSLIQVSHIQVSHIQVFPFFSFISLVGGNNRVPNGFYEGKEEREDGNVGKNGEVGKNIEREESGREKRVKMDYLQLMSRVTEAEVTAADEEDNDDVQKGEGFVIVAVLEKEGEKA